MPTVWQTLGWIYIYIHTYTHTHTHTYMLSYIHPALCIYYYYSHFYRLPESVTTRKPGFKARSSRTPKSWTLGHITREWVHQFACACICAQSFQSCLALCHCLNYSLPGSSVNGILQARILDWADVPFSGGIFQKPRDQTPVSCIAGRFFTSEPSGKPTNLLTGTSLPVVLSHSRSRAATEVTWYPCRILPWWPQKHFEIPSFIEFMHQCGWLDKGLRLLGSLILFFKIFFLMWAIFEVFIEFVTTSLLFYFFVFWPPGTWDPSSPARDQTHTPCTKRWSLNHWTIREVPGSLALISCSADALYSIRRLEYCRGRVSLLD